MSKKSLTKDCPSCKFMFIDDDNQFICKWGKNNKTKILVDGKRTKRILKKCTLER